MNNSYENNSFKALLDSKGAKLDLSESETLDSNIENENSFKYDPLGYPIKSTQQLNVDWTKFENHTFFSSAEVKVNESFNRIINGYPFDGTKKETEEFLDSLTGYEKWVFDQFPTWSGALHFSGSFETGENSPEGNWIYVEDLAGNYSPEISKTNTGERILNPKENDSISIEFLIKIPNQKNKNQIIAQKSSGLDKGFTLFLNNSGNDENYSDITWCVSSGSYRNSITTQIEKNKPNHICAILDKTKTESQILQIIVNGKIKNSESFINFKKLDIDSSPLVIGSGSSFYCKENLIQTEETLSGSIDEFRIFHSVRTLAEIEYYSTRGIFSNENLKLYYRFNEPPGPLSINDIESIEKIVLDSSGNSLHSQVKNFRQDCRVNSFDEFNNSLKNEKDIFKKILFPAYQEIIDLNISLLSSASLYDESNPNNILKLIPKHYLLEGASFDGFNDNIKGLTGNPIVDEGIPGQGKLAPSQIILSFLYIWSKFFDELKLIIDSFVTLRTVDYDSIDTIPDNFLEDLVKYYGFYLPKFFNHSSVNQFVEGENIDGLSDINTPLKKIQSILVRRVLVNMPEIIRSKGTRHSIKAFLRSIGIDPENSLKIREYGGSKIKYLENIREKRTESLGMVDFGYTKKEIIDGQEFPFFLSKPLFSKRIEPGYPKPKGAFVLDPITQKPTGTNYKWDGLLTSGSWSVEGSFKIPPQRINEIIDNQSDSYNQSLLKFVVTGSNEESQYGLVANIVATKHEKFPYKSSSLKAYIRPGTDKNSPVHEINLDIPGEGLFDGDIWNVSFGCLRNDEINSEISSSYYLRVAKHESGEINDYYVTSSFFKEINSTEENVFRFGSDEINSQGCFILIGGNQIPEGTSDNYLFLNNTLKSYPVSRTSNFIGYAGNLRFWSKYISEEEWKEHVKNPKSVGVDNSKSNYNFVNYISGSFQKLRLDTLQKQSEKITDISGRIDFNDYSLNNFHIASTPTNHIDSHHGFFKPSFKAITGDIFQYSYLSPVFDESATDEKIRIRGLENIKNLERDAYAFKGPTYLKKNFIDAEEIEDDLRLSIEFSMIDSLDKDIMSMFSSHDELGDALGKPELMFSNDYPDLEVLRDVYFNRLTGKPDFRKFLEFYRWFDISISSFIEQLLPSKTRYKGTNYVVESHVLERNKHSYRHSDNYVGNKIIIQDSLKVQQIVGRIKKY